MVNHVGVVVRIDRADLLVHERPPRTDFAREEVDLAVRHGEGIWPGLDTVRLSAEQLFAVCSPKLLSGRRRLSKRADILNFPLLPTWTAGRTGRIGYRPSALTVPTSRTALC